MKVIFIDDSEDFLRSMEVLFSMFPFKEEFVSFVDAFEALDYISRNHREISGVVTDFKMSSFGVSGEIIVKKCEELKVPVCICTGYDCLTSGEQWKIIPKTQLDSLIEAFRDFCEEGAA